MSDAHPEDLLASGAYVDSDHPAVIAFAREAAGNARHPVEQAVALYYRVRDDVLYDPYIDYGAPDSYRASSALLAGRGFCIPKAALMAAGARALGIPARVGFADVRNHLATPRLLNTLGSDVFIWHGFAELWLEGRWVKATPTFNLSLCQRFGVHSLDFDGRQDALLHPFDRSDRKHMEYVRQRGIFTDVPYDVIVAEIRQTYPRAFEKKMDGDFAGEAAQPDD